MCLPYPECEPCPECLPCPECEPCPECLVTPGVIFGCVSGCCCCKQHEWEVKLYQIYNGEKVLLYCEKIDCFGYFEFEVPFDNCYVLKICSFTSYKTFGICKPKIILKNVGVSDLIIE